MNNSETLKALMAKHGKSPEQVADMLNVSAYSVRAWARGSRAMPINLIELLTFKLEQTQ